MKLRTSLPLIAVFPIAFSIAVLSMLSTPADSSAEKLSTALVVALGLAGVGFSAAILWLSSGILRKLHTLEEWADAVLMGDLDKAIEMVPSGDEIGMLSEALSKMVRQLKDAYDQMQGDVQSSRKQALQHKEEAVQFKRGAEASLKAANRISQALKQVKETREAELQRERSEALEQAIRGMTHDFSEAMVPIAGTCEVLLGNRARLDEDVLERIETIHAGAERAKKLLKNLAGLFHAEQGTDGPSDAAVIAWKVVDELSSGHVSAKRSDSRIEMETSIGDVPAVGIAENDLHDVLSNLVLNAIEAMPEGGSVQVKGRVEGSEVVLEVCDTGKGMSPHVHACCLEPFFSTKPVAGGGLGLVQVNNIVTSRKGQIEFETKRGVGTVARVRLPIWIRSSSVKDTSVNVDDTPRPLSVLMVDDDPTCRQVISMILSRAGHTVETAARAEEGLEKIKSQQFDVAIVDRAMPDMGGDELALLIRDTAWDLPVVMLTGYGGIMSAERRLPGGVDVVVGKPATLEELNRSMQNARTVRDKRVASRPQTPKTEKSMDASGKASGLKRHAQPGSIPATDGGEAPDDQDGIHWIG